MEPVDLVTLINSAGVIGVLVWNLYLRDTGRVVPRDLLDEVIASTVRQVLKILREEER